MAAAAAAAAARLASSAPDLEPLIPGLQRWVKFCNSGAAAAADFLPLTVDGKAVGHLRPRFADRLLQFAHVFQRDGGGVTLHPGLATQQARTAAIASVLQQLRADGLIAGWRDELYPVVRSFHDEPAFLVERAAAPHFGIKAYGGRPNACVCMVLPSSTHVSCNCALCAVWISWCLHPLPVQACTSMGT